MDIVYQTVLAQGIFVSRLEYIQIDFNNIINRELFSVYLDQLNNNRDVFICFKNKSYVVDTFADLYKEIDFSVLSLNDNELDQFRIAFNQIPTNNTFMISVATREQENRYF